MLIVANLGQTDDAAQLRCGALDPYRERRARVTNTGPVVSLLLVIMTQRGDPAASDVLFAALYPHLRRFAAGIASADITRTTCRRGAREDSRATTETPHFLDP